MAEGVEKRVQANGTVSYRATVEIREHGRRVRARATFPTLALIAAGANAKAISIAMGHSSISVTYDIYGHLMPGARDELRDRLDEYLRRADTTGRLHQLDDD